MQGAQGYYNNNNNNNNNNNYYFLPYFTQLSDLE